MVSFKLKAIHTMLEAFKGTLLLETKEKHIKVYWKLNHKGNNAYL